MLCGRDGAARLWVVATERAGRHSRPQPIHPLPSRAHAERPGKSTDACSVHLRRVDADPEGYGKRVYARLVERLVENGTTLASVFGTLTVEAK